MTVDLARDPGRTEEVVQRSRTPKRLPEGEDGAGDQGGQERWFNLTHERGRDIDDARSLQGHHKVGEARPVCGAIRHNIGPVASEERKPPIDASQRSRVDHALVRFYLTV